MRELYGSFKSLLANRKEYFGWKLKQVNYTPERWLLVFYKSTPQEIEDYYDNLKRDPFFSRFSDKYVDKKWLDVSNWKIAYDVWMSKGKEYNKISIQAYHTLLNYVIPYIESEMKSGRRVRCDRVLTEALCSTSYGNDVKSYEMYRSYEFLMAVIYDTQKYK